MEFTETQKLSETTGNETLKKELQYLLKLGQDAAVKIVEIIGVVFIKTKTVITGLVPEKGTTVKSALANFKKAAGERGMDDIYIDDDITGWFGKEKSSPTVPGPSRLVRFAKDITHRDIIDTAKQLNAYQEVDVIDGIHRAAALVAAGELDEKNNRGVIIYLTNRRGGMPCRLRVWRGGDGRLRLCVRVVGLDGEWDAGGGALVSNENLGE